MSSLGYAHDSMLLMGAAANTTTELDNHPMLPKEEGATADILLVRNNSNNNVTTASQQIDQAATVKQRGQRKRRKKKPSYSQYSGFAADYAEYENNGGLSYDRDESLDLLGTKQKKGDFVCCLCPWTASNKTLEKNHDGGVDNEKKTETIEAPAEENGDSSPAPLKLDNKKSTSDGDNKKVKTKKILDVAAVAVKKDNTDGEATSTGLSDDEISTTGSEAYGEKLTENERAAVLARLHLASPEITAPPPIAATPIVATPATKASDHHNSSGGRAVMNNHDNSNNSSRRRGLFDNLNGVSGGVEEFKENVVEDLVVTVDEKATAPSDSKTIVPKKKLKSILRQMKDSNNDCSDGASVNSNNSANNQRRSLFPQQRHYTRGEKKKLDKSVSFASMARVMTVKSGSNMSDLEKSQIWWQKNDYEDFKTTGRLIAKAICQGGSEIWLANNNAWQRNLNKNNKNKQMTTDPNNSSSSTDKKSTTGDKWWHKFGHSRRGLEHIASSGEGRERQITLQAAIRVVTGEQRRQKMYRSEDPEKLRKLSLQYTTWARDLAFAAAASDAEAVRVNFDKNRRSREFYLLKNAQAQNTNNGFSSLSQKQVPSFMSPGTMTKTSRILDQNTSTQIQFRSRAIKSGQQARIASRNSSSSVQLPIHDSKNTDMAKKAAGFGTGNSDVSRILSGMGTDNPMPSMQRSHQKSVGAH